MASTPAAGWRVWIGACGAVGHEEQRLQRASMRHDAPIDAFEKRARRVRERCLRRRRGLRRVAPLPCWTSCLRRASNVCGAAPGH